VKPTTPRTSPIAEPATTMLRAWSCSRCASVSGGPTSFARGIASAAKIPTAKITEPVRNTHAALVSFSIAAANGAATAPHRTAINARRELARTSSSGLSTTAGTSALFATE
jgi:hypothetical protein